MTKQDLAAKVAEKTGMGHLQSVKAVEAVMETIVESVSDGASVFLRGFGTFKTVHPKGEEGPRHQQGRDHHASGNEEAGVQALQGIHQQSPQISITEQPRFCLGLL